MAVDPNALNQNLRARIRAMGPVPKPGTGSMGPITDARDVNKLSPAEERFAYESQGATPEPQVKWFWRWTWRW